MKSWWATLLTNSSGASDTMLTMSVLGFVTITGLEILQVVVRNQPFDFQSVAIGYSAYIAGAGGGLGIKTFMSVNRNSVTTGPRAGGENAGNNQ
jgi:hypothetical protein